MKVSVLLTHYRTPELLVGAVESVLSQTYTDLELLVMDDGSPEKLPSLPKDRRLRVKRFATTTNQRRESVRYATLMQWGTEHTSGECVTYLSADDYFLPDRLSRMVAKIKEGWPCVYGPQLMLDENGQQMGIRPAPGVLTDAFARVDLNSVMLRRDAIERAGPWIDRPPTPDLWRTADGIYWRQLHKQGYGFVPIDGDAPGDVKRYRPDSVDMRVRAGLEAWA